jgi:hypothetical protein
VRPLNRPTFRRYLAHDKKKCFKMAIFKDFLEHSKIVGERAIFNGSDGRHSLVIKFFRQISTFFMLTGWKF